MTLTSQVVEIFFSSHSNISKDFTAAAALPGLQSERTHPSCRRFASWQEWIDIMLEAMRLVFS